MSGQSQTEHYPAWWYCGRRPSSDDLYFENLCRIIFQTGLNWSVVEKKWPTIKIAFLDFNVDRIAAFNDTDVKQLLNDKGIIRNKYKICAIIENAKKIQQIKHQYGSFQAYVYSFDKSNNYAKVTKALADCFERIRQPQQRFFFCLLEKTSSPNVCIKIASDKRIDYGKNQSSHIR